MKGQPKKSAGKATILTPHPYLKHQLLNIEQAGRTCYKSQGCKVVTEETASKFVRKLIARGHESVLEHSSMTVRFTGVSRGFTHEMARHRLASFSQESTRYVDYKGDDGVPFVLPPGASEQFSGLAEESFEAYDTMRRQGHPPEDARQLLPIGTCSDIVVTANLRQWRAMFALRCDKPAHWEIRSVMVGLLLQCRKILPVLFEDFVFGGTHKDAMYFTKLLSKREINKQVKLQKIFEEQQKSNPTLQAYLRGTSARDTLTT